MAVNITNNKKYELLEHPSELRFRIYGKTIEELFSNAAEAMADVLATRDKRQVKKTKKEIMKIQSIDINSLLVDFLSEILAKSQINKCAYLISDIEINASCLMLRASCACFPVEHFNEDIKAVTYQDLNVRQINPPAGRWQTVLVFDI